MPSRIHVLEDALADQIAAGEVVERPASVVKELIENAIDAAAARLRIEMESGGVALIRVVDDGAGMSPEDAALCVRRHATSKLRRLEDLEAIRTLGFRGEALPSIASVSRFTLITREREAHAGTRVVIEGGASLQIGSVGCAPGTTVEVRDLFYNLPARLKFLKSRATESGHVASSCTRSALAYPELALTLSSDGRVVREFLRASSFFERVQGVFAGEALVSIHEQRGGVEVIAALGAPERARNGATGLHLLVNGRPVRDAALARAVAFAYGSVLPPGRYPLGALHLRLPPDQVDVNAHPQKLELRFRNGREVFDVVTRVLAKALGTSAWSGPARRAPGYWEARLRPSLVGPNVVAPSGLADAASSGPSRSGLDEQDGWGLAGGVPVADLSREAGGVSGVPRADLAGGLAGAPDPTAPGAAGASGAFPVGDAPGAEPSPPFAVGTTPPTDAPPSSAADRQASLAPHGFFGSLRVLGQVRRMLIVCEGRDALYILDQHAADERVRFDRLYRAHQANEIRVQRLLFPERVECSESEAALVESERATLARLGLECSALGPTTVAVHSIPALLARARPERLLRDVLSELERAGPRAFSGAIDRVLATMACHAAIRAGDALPIEEAEALLRNLDEVGDFAGHCPHGRPVVQVLPLDDIERKLGR